MVILNTIMASVLVELALVTPCLDSDVENGDLKNQQFVFNTANGHK